MIERTLVLLKPDAVKRGIIGRIISRFEDMGLKVVGMKMIQIDRTLAEKHYTTAEVQVIGMGNKTLNAAGEQRAKEIFGTTKAKEIGLQLVEWMRDFIIEIPVVAIVLEGDNVVELVRKIVGFTDPSKAEKGTIRRDWGEDSIAKANEERRATENLVHASGSKEESEQEITLWFKLNELYNYKTVQEVHTF